MANKEPKTGRLTAFGKFLIALLSGAVALTVLYSFFNALFYAKEESLVVEGFYQEFSLPPESIFSAASERGRMNRALDELAELPSSGHRDTAVTAIREANQSSLKTFENLIGLETFVHLEIKNEGLKQAEHVAVELTNFGVFEIQDSKLDSSAEFTRTIPVGDIPPSSSRVVRIWTKHRLIAAEPPRVTYTNGFVPVEFRQDARATTNWWSYISVILIVSIAVLASVLLVIIFGLIGKPLVTQPAASFGGDPKDATPKNITLHS